MLKALYIHIPFCRSICSYCDFYKLVAKEKLQVKYVEYLVRELEMQKQQFLNIETIYIGGGTPSALPKKSLELLLTSIQSFVPMEKIIEFTIETNPLDVTEDYLGLLMKYQVNRLSLGVQSIHPKKLDLLKRDHTMGDIENAFSILKKTGFENISVDLLYAVGDEPFKRIQKDIDFCIKQGVKHLSCYALILEPKTLLHHWYQSNQYQPMEDDKESVLYHQVRHYLEKSGFHQYEVSNFSQLGYESKHNLVYWNDDEFLGLGASASSYLKDKRIKNVTNLEEYFLKIDSKCLPIMETIHLTTEEQQKEYMMVGLRKTQGISVEAFVNRFQKKPMDAFLKYSSLVQKGYLIEQGDRVFIPIDYFYVQNAIIVELF